MKNRVSANRHCARGDERRREGKVAWRIDFTGISHIPGEYQELLRREEQLLRVKFPFEPSKHRETRLIVKLFVKNVKCRYCLPYNHLFPLQSYNYAVSVRFNARYFLSQKV